MNPQQYERLLKHFRYANLPEHLQDISRPVCDLAIKMVNICDTSIEPAEVIVGLRKLLEAKDCFVRAMVK